ncbi:hypothetical protein BMF94_4895 [Rhodotorula taiwanensis]|uniref:Uncharacterized protein n=1 Tax=Rhodotorula taiwanensis TaxID=741276 RepID=A0A2S5B5N4_9BASI|nr:hypothetical protein BMF94_4895 [Rhodotorula taiwanensis]
MASYGLSVLPSLADPSPNRSGNRFGTSSSPRAGSHDATVDGLSLGSYFSMPDIYSPAGSGTRRESNASSSSSTSGSGSDDDTWNSAIPHLTASPFDSGASSMNAHSAVDRSAIASSSYTTKPSLSRHGSSSSSSHSHHNKQSASAAAAASTTDDADEESDDMPIQPLPMHLPRPKTKQDRERERAVGGAARVNGAGKREALGTRLARKRADSLKWAKYASVGTFEIDLGLSNDELRRG